jgi:hypothetical protein
VLIRPSGFLKLYYYHSENNHSSYSYDDLRSDKPFSGFGVAILDASAHDYVIYRLIDYVQEPHNAYSGQGAKEFGVAILDDSIHNKVFSKYF